MYGFLFGSLFPITVVLIESFHPKHDLDIFASDHAYLFFIILSAPIILGFTFYFIGVRESQYDKLNEILWKLRCLIKPGRFKKRFFFLRP